MMFGPRLIICTALAALWTTSVFAQAIPEPVARDAQRIQEQEQERQRVREEQFREVQQVAPTGTEVVIPELAGEDNGECVAVKSVKLTGATLYPDDEFKSDIDRLVGDCISITDINNALRAITNRYITDGYITSRAVVGPQNLQDGALEIVIIEGQIDEIGAEEGGYGRATLTMAFPGLKKKRLNLRDLEQGVDQLSRLSSYEADIDIEPAELPGASNILVKRKKLADPIRPSFSVNNDGSQSTGRWQSTLTVDADNILGRADYWSVYFSRGLENENLVGTEGYGAFLSVPYGYWTLTGTVGRYEYRSILEGSGQAFSSTGRSWNGSLSLDRLLYRDAKTKVAVIGGLSLLDTENRIQNIRLSTSSYRQITGNLDARVDHRLGQGLLSLSAGVTRGLDILGANAVDTGPGGPSIKFWNVDTNLSYQAPLKLFGISFNYSGLLRAQASLTSVFPSQRFSLGGSSTVRGFRDDGLSGRYGVFSRQQLGFLLGNIYKEKAKTQIVGILGYDVGGIIPRGGDPFERGVLHSSTAGLRFQHRHFQAELSASVPFSSPSFVEHKGAEIAASLRLTY